MNDEEIERELERLAPSPVPDALLSRLFVARPAVGKIVRFRLWLPLAAAAALVIGFILLHSPPPPSRTEQGTLESFQPVEADRYLVSARDLGVVELQPGQPYRLVHCVWADHETFRSDRGPSQLEVRQAREQIIPVALHLQ